MKNKPPYSISSVDHALHLASLLQHEGPMRVTDAAERLGVSASTAHRLLAMLVYRDFAEQGPDRRYYPGKVLGSLHLAEAPVALLSRAAIPHLEQLVRQVRETANLLVLTGTEVRFIATVECDQVLRVGDRVGRTLPAHLTSAGKAILAGLPAGRLEELYDELPDVDLPRLKRELGLVRRRGFAINDQRTEAGLTAVGVVVRASDGPPLASVSLALPTARFDRELLSTWVSALSSTASKIEAELAAAR